MKIAAQNMLSLQIVLNVKKKPICEQNTFSTCSEVGIFMYWTRNSMNNILSYCGLTYARMRASEKDLPVPSFLLPRTWRRMLHNCLQASTFAKASDSCTQCIFLIIFPENENALIYYEVAWWLQNWANYFRTANKK